MEKRVENILRRNYLSVTDTRKKILQIFLSKKQALAHGDIEHNAGEQFDRITVYRTLQTFAEKGIIHTIPTSDNSVRYALCKDECTDGQHRDHHIHFICDQCENTYCLDDIVTPEINLPIGYTPGHVEVIVEGVCKKCQ